VAAGMPSLRAAASSERSSRWRATTASRNAGREGADVLQADGARLEGPDRQRREVAGKGLAEARVGALAARVDGVERQPEAVGRLLAGEARAVDEVDHLPEGGREALERPLEEVPHLASDG